MSPKRSLGQNFLNNTFIVDKILELAQVSPEDTILEIGPGKGIMTRMLLQSSARVIAVEKDDDLAPRLVTTLNHDQRLSVVHGDILEQDFISLAPPGTKLVANLPYNISTQVILRLTEIPGHYSAVVVMVQKEVGERICASPGTHAYGSLSVLVAAGYDAREGFIVGPGNFNPPPKVDSMVIKLTPRTDAIDGEDLRMLKLVAQTAFTQRRKMLRNNLSALPGMDPDMLIQLAEQSDIKLTQRPQELTREDFLRLMQRYCEIKSKKN